MNPNGGHHAMNGFNAASSGSHNFTQDFSNPVLGHDLLGNNASVHHQRQQQHQSHPMLQQSATNPWQQQQQQQHLMNPNGQMAPSNIHPQQMQFNPGAWNNQMGQAQQFANAMMPMGFNMPLISQQIIQEAVSMSTPVDAGDEPVLLTTLLRAKKAERSFREALNSLHGTSGHSATLWKDYYLEHKDRLDDWIDTCISKERTDKRVAAPGPWTHSANDQSVRRSSAPTVKKPSASLKSELSPHASSRLSISTPPLKHAPKKSTKPTPTPPVEVAAAGRRNTMNSLSVSAPVFGSRLPAPNADIKVPEPPSRSPSPPTNIVPQGRGNKYTPEDREFFIKFIGWRLKQDSSLNRNDLCNLLAEKAPHHSAMSWASYWSNNHDLPDKILAAAGGDGYMSEEESSEGDKPVPIKRRPKYADSTTSEEDDEAEEEDGDDDNDEDTARIPVKRYKKEEMAETGASYNEADLYITAKYIAEFPHWETVASKDRWERYHSKHPQRTAKSWAEYYRRNEGALLKMAKRIKREESSDVPNQHAARSTGTPLTAKRKLDQDSEDETPVKRGKAE